MAVVRFREKLAHVLHLFTREEENIDLLESTPLLFMHVALVGLFFVGFSWIALAVCVALYLVRVFGITAGYHRYFSHNSYKTSRPMQFLFAWLGASSAQLGPLWWAAHHRHHHQHADTEVDVHSPRFKGFFWSHIGWLLCKKYAQTELERIPDFAKYPELCWLDRFHVVPALLLAFGLYGLGAWLERVAPGLGTSAWQLVLWGFFLSTVLVYHATFCINSLTHMMGTRRYNTRDDSRNSLLLALLTLGEGWHNNHHRYPVSTRQGFYWWEIDITYYLLRGLAAIGLVWDLRPPPPKVYEEAKQSAT